jgi:transcriptional regulator with XRE-family HTH domain
MTIDASRRRDITRLLRHADRVVFMGEKTWGRYIKTHRQRLNMGMTEFGSAVGVSRQTVHRWESGENVPTAYDQLAAIASAVGDDVAITLRAAGQERAEPGHSPVRDAEIAAIWASQAPPWLKRVLVEHVLSQRAADRARREQYVADMLRHARQVTDAP